MADDNPHDDPGHDPNADGERTFDRKRGAPGTPQPDSGQDREAADAERRRRRARFLSELAEAKALRERVRPHHARAERLRGQLRMRSFRW
ncbi:hypothetical protein [Streptomyces sp. NBC_01497]|uniref:hypothetical protein n=1 Tax=Streptomyces sp. NBC_01497 TaxID=2903885 RepID=UPI003FCCCB44